jgi:hypothetical protein
VKRRSSSPRTSASDSANSVPRSETKSGHFLRRRLGHLPRCRRGSVSAVSLEG